MYDLQDGLCFYCGEELKELTKSGKIKHHSRGCRTTIDHFIPKSQGGKNIQRWENKVWACFQCNNQKGNRLPTSREKKKFEELQKRFLERIKELQQKERIENEEKKEIKKGC